MPARFPPAASRGDPSPASARRAGEDPAGAAGGDPRQRPGATRELAGMFDDVSERYDLLNSLMSLGRDRAWRRAMWSEVPEEARAVLDLCTGSGASLAGLRRPGRLVIGLDTSPAMLARAAAACGRAGWAPRLACADAFRLPIADQALDCVTIAFGVRNLRPRGRALAEIGRALKPGGLLIVLEATAPGRGTLAPIHSLWIRRVLPLAGRLSRDPSAYEYLARSIVEFGSGPEFEDDLARAGYETLARRSFLLGATRLWVARRAAEPGSVHPARPGETGRGELPNPEPRAAGEWRLWNGIQLVVSAALTASLALALWRFVDSGVGASLEPWQRTGMRTLLVVGTVGFVVRTAVIWRRLMRPPPRH